MQDTLVEIHFGDGRAESLPETKPTAVEDPEKLRQNDVPLRGATAEGDLIRGLQQGLDLLVTEDPRREGLRGPAGSRHLILNEEPARLAHMARYLVRPPVATDRVHATVDGRVLIETPPDPHTGATTLVLYPLEWVRRMTNQIPDARTHLVRDYGAHANRSRKLYRDEDGEVEVEASGRPRARAAPTGPAARAGRGC